MNKIFLSILSLFLLTLTACGGGPSSSTGTTAASSVTALSGVVSLTGVVVSGTSAGGATTGPAIHGVFANALIIAADKSGNTITTTSDRTGKFKLKLTSGVSYAIIFIDGKTQKLLGSLVQAGNTAVAGAVNLTGSDDLGNVVINPKTQKAVSEKDANGTLAASTVGPAPTNIAATNGVVTKASIDQVAVSNAATGTITQLSVTDFFAKPNTWWSMNNTWKDPYTGTSGAEYALSVAEILRTPGPTGTPVDAVKSSSVTYYSSYIDPANPASSSSGYYMFNTALGYQDYSSPTFTSPPSAFDFFSGPWTWAQADYADAANNVMYSNYNLGDPYSTWSKSVPLNITLGVPVTINQSDPYGAATDIITVTLAQEAGKPYILTDTNSKKHTVIQVQDQWTYTPNQTQCQNNLQRDPYACNTQTQNWNAYVVAGYGGASVDVKDPITGANRTPSVALATVQFGDISTNAAGVATFTNVNPLAATTSKLTTNAQRDQFLTYIWNGRSQAGVIPTNTSQGQATQTQAVAFQPYFYSTYDAYGNAASPASWDPATYMPTYLIAGVPQTFSTTVNYATGAAGVNFYLEFRQYDPATFNSVLISGSQSVAVPAVATNQIENTFTVSSSLTVPSLASLNAFNQYTYWDPATNTNVTEGNVELWLVMKDAQGAIVMEQMLDFYMIH